MPRQEKVGRLENWEPVVGGVLAVGFLAGAGLALYEPPSAGAFPPQCSTPACLASVKKPPATIIASLVAVGAVFALVSLNGLRLRSLKLPGGLGADAVDTKVAVQTLSRAKDKEPTDQASSRTCRCEC